MAQLTCQGAQGRTVQGPSSDSIAPAMSLVCPLFQSIICGLWPVAVGPMAQVERREKSRVKLHASLDYPFLNNNNNNKRMFKLPSIDPYRKVHESYVCS